MAHSLDIVDAHGLEPAVAQHSQNLSILCRDTTAQSSALDTCLQIPMKHNSFNFKALFLILHFPFGADTAVASQLPPGDGLELLQPLPERASEYLGHPL